jgi:hypothetical protein
MSQPPKSALLERKREVLGHCIRIAVYPHFNPPSAWKINVFSDTVLIAAQNLALLMKAAASLFYCFSTETLHARGLDELFLLRGGLSFGEVLASESITSEMNIEVASIFDTSLALAYRLEQIRKGSRIFMSNEAYSAAVKSGITTCQSWQSVTGIGPAISPAFEFLWPAGLFQPEDQFTEYLLALFATWRRLFTAVSEWSLDQYNKSLYHLDETIKLFIRSTIHAPECCAAKTWSALLELLPTSSPELASLDARFTWGTWFQALWKLLELRDKYTWLAPATDVRDIVRSNMDIVRACNHFPTFFSELQNPDYGWFRTRLKELTIL